MNTLWKSLPVAEWRLLFPRNAMKAILFPFSGLLAGLNCVGMMDYVRRQILVLTEADS